MSRCRTDVEIDEEMCSTISRYMLHIDGYSPTGEETEPDGFIDLEEWQGYFRYLAEDDTRNAEVRGK